jgi:hypothetical protein
VAKRAGSRNARARGAARGSVGQGHDGQRAILDGEKMASGDIALLLAAAGYRLQPDVDTLGGLQFALNAAPIL